jgi:hypothetical protein
MFEKRVLKGGLLCLVLLLMVLAGCSKEKAGKKVWIERWSPRRPMTLKRAGLGAVSIGRKVYVIGGGKFGESALEIFASVEYADVAEDGAFSEWKPAPSLTMPRIYIATAVYNGYVYVMGGESLDTIYEGGQENPPKLLDSVERAKILDDGTLGEWVLEENRMHTSRRGGEFYIHNGWAYAVGGFNGAFLNDVERAKVREDGSLGKWIREQNWPARLRYISGYASKGDRLYVLGGHQPSIERAMYSVETAVALGDGAVSEWKETSPMYVRRFLNTAVLAGDSIYSISGHNSIDLTSTERASILADGMLGAWEPDTPLNNPRRAAASVFVGDTLYVLGGMLGPIRAALSLDDVESAIIAPDKKLGGWALSGSAELESYKEWKAAVPVDAKGHLYNAIKLLPRGNYKKVFFDIDEALRIHPEYLDAYNLKGDVSYRMGRVDAAIEALKKSIEIKADDFSALVGLGSISFEQKDFQSALDYYKRAVQSDPESVPVHYNLGNTYLSMKEYAAASEEFEWVLEKEPDAEGVEQLLEVSRAHLKGYDK